MAIRLDHVRIQRGGPLRADFELAPGDLNLVYGRNETGKTYLVEALVRVLFAKGKRSGAAWALRDWDLKGRVSVSGLGAEPVAFTATGRSLEEHWEQAAGLPPDLARLLVVKGGDALLAADAADGVGTKVLRTYLSGEGLLDGIAAGISATVQKAVVAGRQIVGPAMGELKAREERRQRLAQVDGLLTEVEERYGSGRPHLLRREIAGLRAERDRLEAARRHRAAVVAAQLDAAQRQQGSLPDQEVLARLAEQVGVYESKAADAQTKAERLAEYERTDDDYGWAGKAAEAYRELTAGAGGGGARPVLLIAALALLAAAVGAGLMGWPLPMVVGALAAAGLVGAYYREARGTLARAGESRELERLRAEFQRRFGTELADRAALEAQLARLQANDIRAAALRQELESARVELRQLAPRIAGPLAQYADGELEPGDWREALGRLRRAVEAQAATIRSLERSLEALGVSAAERLEADPEVAWEPARYEELTAQLETRSAALTAAAGELARLRTRALQELGRQDGDWEELIQALRDRRAATVAQYRQLTAEILGKIQVAAAVQELRAQEKERIAAALRSAAMGGPLRAITGRYHAVRQGEEGELVLQGDLDECPLSMASTGTREQALLGLRLGFASHLMKGQKGFLILDDAFQHSDWVRRGNGVQVLLGLVAAGWQVFYFTMDDHLRGLFQRAGAALGPGYREVELG
ncbi:MAG: AAA family ATPase [Gemmatimonadota bacterium]